MSQTHTPPLQALRIPANWAITHNTFFELDPSESTRLHLCEDLFQAKCAVTDVLVDLGWFPEGDPRGRFVIRALVPDFHGEELEVLTAETRLEAAALLEGVLWRFHHVLRR